MLPSIAGFTDSIQVKGAFVYPGQGVVRLAEMSEWVAQALSMDIHKLYLAAKDYSGCIQSNTGQSPGVSGTTKNSASILGREKCSPSGNCIAQSGQDQLGLAKIVGWLYAYNPANNTVNYESYPKRVPHKGSPLDILPLIMFNIIIGNLSLPYLVITEKLARPKQHVPLLTMVVDPGYAIKMVFRGIKTMFQAKLAGRLLLQKPGLQELQQLQVVLASIRT